MSWILVTEDKGPGGSALHPYLRLQSDGSLGTCAHRFFDRADAERERERQARLRPWAPAFHVVEVAQ